MNTTFAAITAKYLPPTNYYGSRIKVTSQRGSKTYGVEYAFNFTEQHHAATSRYLDWIKSVDQEKYGSNEGWGGIDDFVSGVTHTGEYIYVRKQNQ